MRTFKVDFARRESLSWQSKRLSLESLQLLFILSELCYVVYTSHRKRQGEIHFTLPGSGLFMLNGKAIAREVPAWILAKFAPSDTWRAPTEINSHIKKPLPDETEI